MPPQEAKKKRTSKYNPDGSNELDCCCFLPTPDEIEEATAEFRRRKLAAKQNAHPRSSFGRLRVYNVRISSGFLVCTPSSF